MNVINFNSRALLRLAWVAIFLSCSASAKEVDSYYDEVATCIANVRQSLDLNSRNMPRLRNIREALVWISANLPSALDARFDAAGENVKNKISDWTASNAIYSPFWNIQLIDELLFAQYFNFDGINGCSFDDAQGVAGEIVEDQVYIAFSGDGLLKEKFSEMGISDLGERKRAIMYAILLNKAGIPWSDSDLIRTVRHRSELPDQ